MRESANLFAIIYLKRRAAAAAFSRRALSFDYSHSAALWAQQLGQNKKRQKEPGIFCVETVDGVALCPYSCLIKCDSECVPLAAR
jgi:hypothetical protein